MSATHAIFIGSSNATAGTWPEALCARQGWMPHVYSIGGGAFTQSGPSRFINQLNTAILDTPLPDEVDYLFICDAGNDIRATAPVQTEASDVFTDAEAAFPNARIIVIPALWGITDHNTIPARMTSVTSRFREIQEAALGTKAEVVPWSWLWHWDNPTWMKPQSPTESGVHYTPAGYERIIEFVERYLRGESTDAPIGWGYIFGINAYYVDINTPWLRVRRNGNDAALHGRLGLIRASPQDTHLGWLPRGTTPLETVRVPVISDSRQGGWVDVFPSGQVRAFTPLGVGTWNFNSTMPVF